jgi:hypothetical protein
MEEQPNGMTKRDDAGAPDVEVTSLDPETTRHEQLKGVTRWLRAWPGRLALSALTLLLIAGALVAMFTRASADPIGEARTALGLFTPTPTPVILPGGDTFGLTNAVPWGDLRIDARAPLLTTIEPIGPGFRLSRGAHHLVYRARYFPTLRCVISVPQSPNDTCPLSNLAVTEGLAFQRILDLGALPIRMAPEQYGLLVSAINTALSGSSASATIEPGERYINQLGKVEIARTAMTFTMGLKQAEETRDPDCPFLCPQEVNDSAVATAWMLSARVEPTWTITDAIGRSFSSLIPSAPASHYTPAQPDTVLFAVLLDGTEWRILSQDQSALSSIAQEAAYEAVISDYGGVPVPNGAGWGTTSGVNPADGAIIMILGGASGPQVILLSRFGVLYAASAAAKHQFPDLPLASPREQALARAMAAGFSVTGKDGA